MCNTAAFLAYLAEHRLNKPSDGDHPVCFNQHRTKLGGLADLSAYLRILVTRLRRAEVCKMCDLRSYAFSTTMALVARK